MGIDGVSSWLPSRLGDLVEHRKGHAFKSSLYRDSGHPIVRVSNLTSRSVDMSGCNYICPSEVPEFESVGLKEDDVVIATVGSGPNSPGSLVGRTVRVPCSADGALLNQNTVRLRANSALDQLFLFYRLTLKDFQAYLLGGAQGSANQASITLKSIFDFRFELPPRSEQEAIVHVLSTIDDKIELNRRMNRTLEQMAAAIFKAWFVDFEPVKAKADGAKSFPSMPQGIFDALPTEFTDCALGPIPKGWDVRAIADLARYVNGRAFTKHANGQGRMIIRIAELNSGPGGSTKYGEMEVDEENTAYPDDILFPWSGSLGVYRWHRAEAIINQHIFKVIPEGYPKWFVYFALLDALSFFRMVAAGKATTMGHIQRHHLSDAKLAVATDGLIETAGILVEPLYAMIHANEMQSGTLATIRDALLPKLLSGEIRVGGRERGEHPEVETVSTAE